MYEVVDNLGVPMNYAKDDDQVPKIERNDQVLQYIFIIAYYRLSYKKMPRFIIQHLAMISTTKLNIFPDKGGILVYYSPHVILNQINWYYKKHFQYGFVSYIQVSQVNKPINTNLARAVGSIYLRPATNIQRGRELMDLATGRLITQPNFYLCVITKILIKACEKLS